MWVCDVREIPNSRCCVTSDTPIIGAVTSDVMSRCSLSFTSGGVRSVSYRPLASSGSHGGDLSVTAITTTSVCSRPVCEISIMAPVLLVCGRLDPVVKAIPFRCKKGKKRQQQFFSSLNLFDYPLHDPPRFPCLFPHTEQADELCSAFTI